MRGSADPRVWSCHVVATWCADVAKLVVCAVLSTARFCFDRQCSTRMAACASTTLRPSPGETCSSFSTRTRHTLVLHTKQGQSRSLRLARRARSGTPSKQGEVLLPSHLSQLRNKLLLFSDPSYPRNNARPLQDRFFSASALPVFSDCKLTESLLLSLELWSAGARNLPEETRQGQGQGTRHIFEK